jgi:hypothetical protein
MRAGAGFDSLSTFIIMANGHGGSRNGAGRKPGSKNKKTREVADRALAEGITPLEVMLYVMRKCFAEQRYDDAAEVAARCAAYVHPRLGSLQIQADSTVTVIEDAGWYNNNAHVLAERDPEGATASDDPTGNPTHDLSAAGAAPSAAGAP